MEKKKKKSSKKYPGVEMLSDKEDLYGKKYRESLKKCCFGTGIICFACNAELPRHILACRICEYKYQFCGKCWNDHDIFVNRMRCVFCERERNDKICRLLRELGMEVPENNKEGLDLYQDDVIDKLLDKKAEYH